MPEKRRDNPKRRLGQKVNNAFEAWHPEQKFVTPANAGVQAACRF
jgi:hypothetical protein